MAENIITLPTFIDVHQHHRWGQSDKQDWGSLTQANLAGGISYGIGMPNNRELVTSLEQVKRLKAEAQPEIYGDIGVHLGTLGEPGQEFTDELLGEVVGLKAFFDITTGHHIIKDQAAKMRVFERWPEWEGIANGPIMVHAQGPSLAEALAYAHLFTQPLYVCHVSRRVEVDLIRKARDKGLEVYMEVTPHHLMLDNSMELSQFRLMKPELGSPDDRAALWEAVLDETVDTLGTDDAPHTRTEKLGANPPFGVVGAEVALPVLVREFAERGIDGLLAQIINTNQTNIFTIPDQGSSFVDIDQSDEYSIRGEELFTKPKWTWAEGMKAFRVVRTVVDGETKYKDGKILAQKGSGRIFPWY